MIADIAQSTCAAGAIVFLLILVFFIRQESRS